MCNECLHFVSNQEVNDYHSSALLPQGCDGAQSLAHAVSVVQMKVRLHMLTLLSLSKPHGMNTHETKALYTQLNLLMPSPLCVHQYEHLLWYEQIYPPMVSDLSVAGCKPTLIGSLMVM